MATGNHGFEFVAVDGQSFATDLLFNVNGVRARCVAGISTQAALIQLLRCRINLERDYSSELTRMAQRSLLEQHEYDGDFKDALTALRAQYINSSVQHRNLADSLSEGVLDPLEKFHLYNTQKLDQLTKLTALIKKQAKTALDEYKKEFAGFEKRFRDAASAFATAMDRGISSTMIESEYHNLLAQHSSHELSASHQKGKQLSITNNNSQRFVHWLLSSDQQRKGSEGDSTAQLIMSAELDRQNCRQTWKKAEDSFVSTYQTTQSVLTEYQHIAEHRVTTLVTSIQKQIVFESSALANLQYDWQMLASKVERISPDADVRETVAKQSSKMELRDMTVAELWTEAFQSIAFIPTTKRCRPLTSAPLGICDVARRKIPFDKAVSRTPLSEVLVIRDSSMIQPSNETNLTQPSLSVDCPEYSAHNDNNRVVRAVDVAQAIARAYEWHAPSIVLATYEAKPLLKQSESRHFDLDVTSAMAFTDQFEPLQDNSADIHG